MKYSDLRNAYSKVSKFVSKKTGAKKLSLKTNIQDDLGIYGDDMEDLIQAFVKEFNLEYGSFNYSHHFYTEGELFSSSAALKNILSLPKYLFNFIFRKKRAPEKIKGEKEPLTLGDLITWSIEGTFFLRKNRRYSI